MIWTESQHAWKKEERNNFSDAWQRNIPLGTMSNKSKLKWPPLDILHSNKKLQHKTASVVM
jgi:hypothetical protein